MILLLLLHLNLFFGCFQLLLFQIDRNILVVGSCRHAIHSAGFRYAHVCCPVPREDHAGESDCACCDICRMLLCDGGCGEQCSSVIACYPPRAGSRSRIRTVLHIWKIRIGERLSQLYYKSVYVPFCCARLRAVGRHRQNLFGVHVECVNGRIFGSVWINNYRNTIHYI